MNVIHPFIHPFKQTSQQYIQPHCSPSSLSIFSIIKTPISSFLKFQIPLMNTLPNPIQSNPINNQHHTHIHPNQASQKKKRKKERKNPKLYPNFQTNKTITTTSHEQSNQSDNQHNRSFIHSHPLHKYSNNARAYRTANQVSEHILSVSNEPHHYSLSFFFLLFFPIYASVSLSIFVLSP